jgi:8-oxo-dGTP pyrophosphatase MutT (NUDIX family)
MRQAVCALIINPQDPRYILTVSRKDNPADIGLPGGKVDPGETEVQAVIRETVEETGLTVQNPRAIFTQVCHGKEDFLVTTFLCDFPQDGVIQTPEAGKVAWATRDYLLSGSFAPYNRALFDSIDAQLG